MEADFKNSDFDKLAGLNDSSRSRKMFCNPEENPLPLRRKVAEPVAFPLDALGDFLKPVAQRLQESVQAPMALCGQSVLAAACLAAQGHRDVGVDGRQYPISENFVAIAESGERKTSLDKIATRPVRIYEEELQQKHDAQLAMQKNRADAHEVKRKAILRSNKMSKEDMDKALDKLGSPPISPLSPIVLVDDPTYEGTVKLFAVGEASLGLFSDEGGKMLGGVGMMKDNQVKTAAALSQLWDGGILKRVRAGDEAMLATIMRGKRLSMSLMAQPVVARELLGNDVLMGQGLLSRCLFCWPDSRIGDRPYHSIDLSKDPIIERYNNRILKILKAPKKMREDKRNELDPSVIKPGKKAKPLWIKFYNETEQALKDGGKYQHVRSFGAKMPEHALRLAGALTVVSNLEASFIPEWAMKCGISLARYYLDEALRIRHESSENPDLILAEKLLHWLQSRKDKNFYLGQVYQLGPGKIRDAETARRIIKILEAHGWVTPREGMEIKGSVRKEAWELR